MLARIFNVLAKIGSVSCKFHQDVDFLLQGVVKDVVDFDYVRAAFYLLEQSKLSHSYIEDLSIWYSHDFHGILRERFLLKFAYLHY